MTSNVNFTSKLKSFLKGMASLIVPLDTLDAYKPCVTAQDAQAADYDALSSDWQAVGGDIERAMQSYRKRKDSGA